MRKHYFKLFLLTSVVTIGVASVAATDDAVMLKTLAGYREWMRVTPEPVKVEIPALSVAIDPSMLLS